MSPNDLDYLLHVTDEAYMMNAQLVSIKRIDDVQTRPLQDDLFDESRQKVWTRGSIYAVVVSKPS